MRYKKFVIRYMASILLSFISSIAYSQNPIVQTVYTADPAPLVYNDTVFLYTGHDEDSSTWFTMRDWKVFSSTDMVNWTFRGTPLSLQTFAWAKENAWAGQCIERNGKFYWYVPVTEKGSSEFAIGVAVSDHPAGSFKDVLGKPLVGPGFGFIDPTVFIDDDGQAYLYWGNPDLYYLKLNEDMLSYSGEVTQVPLTEESFARRTGDPKRATQYEEGPWFYKRSGLYYLLFAAGGVPEHLAYATSNSPTGNWKYRDTIMPVQGGSFTNHCGVIDFKGKSYFFYHNGALPGGGGFTRSVCVEPFSYNPDGSIPRFNMTREGVQHPAAFLDPYAVNQAETIAWETGIEMGTDDRSRVFVTDIDNNDYIKVSSVDFGKEARSFRATVASGNKGGHIELRLDAPEGKLIGTCIVPSTGSWNKWVSQKCRIEDATGIQDLYFIFKGEGKDIFHFDTWSFTR